ncbi:MAG: VWA domain-containing protein [Gorillibacterium sp.]|nr:VWA domain-containing protein [Gorillibacterium sp.]
MVKKKIRIISRLLPLLLLLCLLFSPFQVGRAYAADTDQKLDAVLAVDVSTSMNDSDRNKVANEAMKMFIDMTSVQGDKIGVIAYTDQIVREKALLKIQSPEDKEDLKTFIDQLDRGPYTDIAVGVREAVKVLESGRESGHHPMIVLLADGNNSLNTGRTQDQSNQELAAAVKKAQAAGIRIYTIGLNADGKLNKAALGKIATDTGGKSFVTDTADTLPQILSEIFASHLKLKVVPLQSFTANGAFQEVTIPIPNANVLEANISIMSLKPVEIQLIDPNGQQQTIPSAGVLYSKSTSYSLVKLTKPTEGDWKLKVKGANRDQIDINLIFNYDLEFVMDPLAGGAYKAGDTINVKAHLESGGQPLGDAELMKTSKSTLFVTDLATKKTEEIVLKNTGSDFTGEWKVPEAKQYELKVRVENASFYRETEPVTVDAASGTVSTPAPNTSPGAVPDSEKKPFPWTYVFIGLVVLILAATACYLIMSRVRKANRGFIGQFIMEIRDKNTGERSNPQYRKLNAFKGKFKLHQLMQLVPEYAETERIVFVPGKGDTLILFNRSECSIEKAGRAVDATSGLVIKKHDRLTIVLNNTEKSIQLEYIL